MEGNTVSISPLSMPNVQATREYCNAISSQYSPPSMFSGSEPAWKQQVLDRYGKSPTAQAAQLQQVYQGPARNSSSGLPITSVTNAADVAAPAHTAPSAPGPFDAAAWQASMLPIGTPRQSLTPGLQDASVLTPTTIEQYYRQASATPAAATLNVMR